MNYQQTLDYMYSRLPMYHRLGAAAYKANLDNILRLCDHLGNPHNDFRSVHIGGTNGKGSSSHLLASIFQEAGLKTGLFTSPHLKDFRERIRINGKMIPKQTVTSFIDRYRSLFNVIKPSFFEMTTALAFDYFASEKIDIAVVEVGMGGRLDSTNVITPLLSVITNIGMDHMAFLGDTREKIAGEKAGIIKNGVPVVIGETQAEVKQVFVDYADKSRSPIFFADQLFEVRNFRSEMKTIPVSSMEVCFNGNRWWNDLKCPLTGTYQQKNIQTILCCAEVLRGMGLPLNREIIRTGIFHVIQNTGLKGRWQVLSRKPLIICDTGHNREGIQQVSDQLAATGYQLLHMVVGFVDDKDLSGIFPLLPKEATYYFCKADIPRGMDTDKLKEAAAICHLKGESYPSVRDALQAAKKAASPNDLIFVGGSTFVVAEVV
ncbi:MAG: bifunctional folylpolyglutamate synthase/dihydrofolate synthase [Bacteroidetes bacterium]|nr:bifunctional folylpolyglutamate synthase/dihydrofolate synthase [Bacteroidota bacterium]